MHRCAKIDAPPLPYNRGGLGRGVNLFGMIALAVKFRQLDTPQPLRDSSPIVGEPPARSSMMHSVCFAADPLS